MEVPASTTVGMSQDRKHDAWWVCDVGRGVNFPTTNAEDPNPPIYWCQLTDEDAFAGRKGVKRPTAFKYDPIIFFRCEKADAELG